MVSWLRLKYMYHCSSLPPSLTNTDNLEEVQGEICPAGLDVSPQRRKHSPPLAPRLGPSQEFLQAGKHAWEVTSIFLPSKMGDLMRPKYFWFDLSHIKYGTPMIALLSTDISRSNKKGIHNFSDMQSCWKCACKKARHRYLLNPYLSYFETSHTS